MTPAELQQVAEWMAQAFLAGFGGVALARVLSRSQRG